VVGQALATFRRIQDALPVTGARDVISEAAE
jgi:hypothetical protein